MSKPPLPELGFKGHVFPHDRYDYTVLFSKFSEYLKTLHEWGKDAYQLNLSSVTWMDPDLLIALGNSLINLHLEKKTLIRLKFGQSRRNSSYLSHLQFIRYLSKEGFISSLNTNIPRLEIEYLDTDDTHKIYDSKSKIREFIEDYSSRAPTKTGGSTGCIAYRFYPSLNLKDINAEVEGVIENAKLSIRQNTTFDHSQREHLLYRLRVILYELMENVCEHAYPEKEFGAFGFFARITTCKENPKYPVLEFFFGDNGRNLFDLERLKEWLKNLEMEKDCLPSKEELDRKFGKVRSFALDDKYSRQEEELSSAIDAIKLYLNDHNDKKVFDTLGPFLFNCTLSSTDRSERSVSTPVAGLKHLGLVLKRSDTETPPNKLRIITAEEGVEGELPFSYFLPDNVEDQAEKNFLIHSSATHKLTGCHYKFKLYALQEGEKILDEAIWPKIGQVSELRDEVFNALKCDDSSEYSIADNDPIIKTATPNIPGSENVILIDMKDSSFSFDAIKETALSTIALLRLDVQSEKIKIQKCLQRALFTSSGQNRKRNNVNEVVIADISATQAEDIFTLLFGENLDLGFADGASGEVCFTLITQSWRVSRIYFEDGHFIFEEDFLAKDVEEIGRIVGLTARLLRSMDSTIFWREVSKLTEPKRAFYLEKGNWVKRSEAKIDIVGYLDLPQSLSMMGSFHAARRALRRVLNFYRDINQAQFIASDDLLSMIVGPSFAVIYGQDEQHTFKLDQQVYVLLNSVLLGGGTTNSFSVERQDVTISETIYLLKHWDSKPTRMVVTALNWVPKVDKQVVITRQELASISRLGQSPYAMRQAGHAPHLIRWATKKELRDVSLYYHDPQSMYSHWESHELIRNGHWAIGGKHDFVGINLSRAIELNVSDDGLAVKWLSEQISKFEAQYPAENFTRLFVYLSHKSTNLLVPKAISFKQQQEIKELSGIGDEHCFSLTMVSHSVQGPISITPLSLERIQAYVNSREAREDFKPDIAILFFNDRAVTGKLQDEISDLLNIVKYYPATPSNNKDAKPLGKNKVASVSIEALSMLDRTGKPSSSYELRIPENDGMQTLWRCDLPTLGVAEDCRLCLAINNLNSYRETIEEFFGARLDEIIVSWSPRSLKEAWRRDEFGCAIENLDQPYVGRYGQEYKYIESESGGTIQKADEYYLTRRQNASLTASTIEIMRSTNQQDYALRLSQNRFADDRTHEVDNPNIRIEHRIELLAGYLLNLRSDATFQQKFAAYYQLFRLVWEAKKTSNQTALGCVTLSLASPSIAFNVLTAFVRDTRGGDDGQEDVVTVKRSDVLRLVAAHDDAEIAYGLLTRIASTSHTFDKPVEELVKAEFFSLFSVSRPKQGFIQNIQRIAAAAEYRVGHSAFCNRLHDLPIRDIKHGLSAILMAIQEVLQKLHFGHDDLTLYYRELQDILETMPFDDDRSWLKKKRQCGYASGYDGLALTMSNETIVPDCLQKVLHSLTLTKHTNVKSDEWQRSVSNRIDTIVSRVEKKLSGEANYKNFGKVLIPSFKFSYDPSVKIEAYYYWDVLIEELIFDVVQNSTHADGKTLNVDDDSYNLIISVSLYADYLIISISIPKGEAYAGNFSDTTSRYDMHLDYLNNCSNSVQRRESVTRGGDAVVTEIRVPSFGFLMERRNA